MDVTMVIPVDVTMPRNIRMVIPVEVSMRSTRGLQEVYTMFTRGRHDVYMCYVGPAAGQCREQCLTQWITGRCRHDLVAHGPDLEVQVLGGGHLHVGVGLLGLHQEGARGSPRLEDSSSSPNAGIVEALGGMNPHPLVGGAEVSAALRAINVLSASDAALGYPRLRGAGEGDPTDRQAQCLASTSATAGDRRVGNLELPLVHGLRTYNIHKTAVCKETQGMNQYTYTI